MAKTNIGRERRNDRANRIFRQMEEEIMDWFSDDAQAPDPDRYRKSLDRKNGNGKNGARSANGVEGIDRATK